MTKSVILADITLINLAAANEASLTCEHTQFTVRVIAETTWFCLIEN